MSYSKFRLKDTNKIFYYQIEENSIFNENGECLSIEAEHSPEWYEDARQYHGTRKKINKPVAMRILLGQACNYSCSYCMQKDIGNPDERPENKQLRQFIDSVEKYLDLENLERIELWGGEPFLYWKDIVPLMQYLDHEKRHFYISTNGSALRQKHVDFFKTLKSTVMIGISHDGPGQELLRGEDIFDKKLVTSVIKQFDDMYPKIGYSFNPVVSLHNYDLMKINDYFKDVSDRLELKNSRISFTLGKIYDSTNSQNSADHVINKDNLSEFKRTLHSYLDSCLDQLKTHGISKTLPIMGSNIFEGTEGFLQYAMALKRKVPITITSGCGADSSDILSIDVQGNVRLCPHTSEKYIAGTINNLKGVRIIQLDLNRKKTHCSDCNVRRLCKSSCPIKFPDEVFLQNCRVEKIWYGAIQAKAFKLIFGEDVELLELGIENINETELKENQRTPQPA